MMLLDSVPLVLPAGVCPTSTRKYQNIIGLVFWILGCNYEMKPSTWCGMRCAVCGVRFVEGMGRREAVVLLDGHRGSNCVSHDPILRTNPDPNHIRGPEDWASPFATGFPRTLEIRDGKRSR